MRTKIVIFIVAAILIAFHFMTRDLGLRPRVSGPPASSVPVAQPPSPSPEIKRNTDEIAFSDAVCSGDCDAIKLLVKKGISVDQRVSGGRYALASAACAGKTAVAMTLIECGANVNGPPGAKEKPIQIAAEFERWQTVAALLDKGSDPDASNELGTTALHSAATKGRLDIVEMLIKKGAKIDARNDHMNTPLDNATSNKHLDVMKALLKAGADPNAMEAFGATPLAKAVSRGSAEMVRELLDAGASVETILLVNGSPRVPVNSFSGSSYCQASHYDDDCGGLTPVHIAVQRAREDILTMLVSSDTAAVNAKSSKEWTPLHFACATNDPVTSKFLIERGSDISAINSDGMQPVHVAAKYNSPSALTVLLEKGVDVNALLADGSKNTPAHIAENHGSSLAAALLYEKCANQTLVNSSNETPIMLKNERKKITAAKFKEFLESPAKYFNDGRSGDQGVLNIGDKCYHGKIEDIHYTRTFLEWPRIHQAITFKMPEAIELFLSEGDDPCATDHEGLSALERAFEKNDADASAILISYGALNKSDPLRCGFFLGTAIRKTWNEVAKLIMKKGVSPSSPGVDGENAMHAAAACGNIEIVSLLAPNARTLDEKCRNGMTPALHAAANGKASCLRALADAGANIAETDNNGEDALSLALQNEKIGEKECTEIVEFLSQKGACRKNSSQQYVWHAMKRGFSPADQETGKFSERHRIRLIEILASNGAPVSFERNSTTPLLEAISKARPEMAAKLVKYGAGISSGTMEVMLLHAAAASLDPDCLRVVIEAGASPLKRDFKGNTAIMKIIQNIEYHEFFHHKTDAMAPACDRAVRMIETLIKRGCDPNAANDDGETPLFKAMKWDMKAFSKYHGCKEADAIEFKNRIIRALAKGSK